MEESNVKKALEILIDYNDKHLNPSPKFKYPDGSERPVEVDDIQDFNTEFLIQIADLLGMSDLYLNQKA